MLVVASLHGQDKQKVERFDFRPLMQQIWDAWGTLDPAKTAKYYSKDAKHVFFDIAPLKYTGWNEYAAGVKKAFADYSSGKFTLYAGGHVAQRGNFRMGRGYRPRHADQKIRRQRRLRFPLDRTLGKRRKRLADHS